MLKKIGFIFSIAILFAACQPKEAIQKTSNAKTPKWSESAVIYEVNTRQYSEEGTFEAFEKHLPRLKELGVDILWFMPIHPIGEKNRKGTLGSYYSISDYRGINPEFGDIEDFKRIVKKSQELDMKIIIDWVANHTAWDHSWIETNPEFYEKDSVGNIFAPYDWEDVAQLDFTNEELRKAMIADMHFWIEEINIDGFRCDVAGMVPTDFWETARQELDEIKEIYMLAEDESELDLLNNAFNSNYGWEIHHIMNDVANGEKNAQDIIAYFEKIEKEYPIGSYPMQFTTNHDENSWNGTTEERMGVSKNTFAALTFVMEGIPLIYSGQEAGLAKRLEFFEKDTIVWDNLETSELYKSLTKLKKDNKALWNGNSGGKMNFISSNETEKVLSFYREKEDNKVVVVFNLSNDKVSVNLDTIIDEGMKNYNNNEELNEAISEFDLEAWEYLIFTN